MSKKCDINIPDDINGNSPLFIATTLKQVIFALVQSVLKSFEFLSALSWDRPFFFLTGKFLKSQN